MTVISRLISIVTAEWGWILALMLFVSNWNEVFLYPEGKSVYKKRLFLTIAPFL